MSKKISLSILLIFCFLFILSFMACNSNLSAPFIISKPLCKIGAESGICQFACISFSFYNASAKTISAIETSCMIYDNAKKNPFIGSNCIRSRFESFVNSQEKKDLSFSLDPNIARVPENEYVIDQFFISKIEYTDGSVWEDFFGIYGGD